MKISIELELKEFVSAVIEKRLPSLSPFEACVTLNIVEQVYKEDPIWPR